MPAAHAGEMSQRGSRSWRWSRGVCSALSWGWPISCLFRPSMLGPLCWRKRSLGLFFQSGRLHTFGQASLASEVLLRAWLEGTGRWSP